MIKLNATIVLEDEASDQFDDLDWGGLFTPMFREVRRIRTEKVFSELHKKSEEEMNPYQKNYLSSEENKSLFEFCSRWLTQQDPFLGHQSEAISLLYQEFLKSNSGFKDLSFERFKEKLVTESKLNPLPHFPQWTANIPPIQEPSLFTSSFNAQLDTDGYVRRYPLLYRAGNRVGSSFIPALALQTYLLATGYRAQITLKQKPNTRNKFVSRFAIFDPNQDDKLVMEMPVDPSGQALVNYYGPKNSLPHIPAKVFFSDSEDMEILWHQYDPKTGKLTKTHERVNKRDFLKGRSLIAGATAIAVYDLRNTPLDANYPGPEIHLTMLANLFDQDFLRLHSGERYWIPILMLIAGIGLSILFSHLTSIYSLIIVTTFFAAGVGINLFLFIKKNIDPSLVYFGLLVLLVYFTITVYRYFTEERKKQELKKTFSKYVSPAIVDELIKDPKNLQLGGKRLRMSVFFSDLRGFTTISEKLSPEELVKLLNRYLSPMTQIVFENKGTLDKYMGDAIMAFFGAPIPYPDHAKYACRCALKSLEKLYELQRGFEQEGLPHVDVGIGINTGEMSVGNMGSNIVQNYTVMGDAVNLASRLEGTNKQYGTRIIISEFTKEDIKDDFVTRELDRVKVKGKNEPVRIYEVIREGTTTHEEQSWLLLYQKGLEEYLKQHFPQAKDCFQKASDLRKAHSQKEDPVSLLYAERCQEFLSDPPPEHWDGVYVMKTK